MMLTRHVREIVGTEREAEGPGWKSRRLLLAGEGRPFSLHETTVDAGAELAFNYRRHAETVYCVEGRGTLEDRNAGRTIPLEPGRFYVAAIGDDHVIRAETTIRFLCVFDPPLEGQEEAD